MDASHPNGSYVGRVSRHRQHRQHGQRGRRPGGQAAARRRVTVVAVAAGAVVVASGVGLGLWASGDDGGPAAAPSSPSPTPSPTRSYPLSEAPRTIPAVREHTAERGPGWRPAPGHRVVVSDPALADEGRLTAQELGLAYAGERDDERPGDVRLELNRDAGANPESYTLTVRGGRVTVSGPGNRASSTAPARSSRRYAAPGAAPEGVVRDEPAKPRRGMMLDIARKHYDAGWIEDRIRELGDLKYNEIGLHFSDDQGFRIESGSHPEVVSKDHLTKAQVKQIVELAESRHITVVPEIDSPGHLGAVIDAHPDLQLRRANGEAVRGAVDIANPKSAEIVDDLLDEYADLFPGDQWHLGGDEYQALVVSDPEASFPGLAAAPARSTAPAPPSRT